MVRSTLTLASLVTVSLLNLVSAGGMIGQVVDATSFCVFLPPPGQMSAPLSDNEWDSQAYCLGTTPKATGANTLPAGFIQSAHYVATDDYVQVTGQIDPAKIGLNPTDEGGQCDIMNDSTNCNRGISQDGCAHVIPGDYSGPMDGSGTTTPSGSASASASASATSAPAALSSSSSLSSSPSSSAPVSSSSSLSVAAPLSSSSVSSASPNKNDPAKPNGSQSGALGQSSITAQSVNQATSMTGRSLVAGGLVGLVGFALVI
ncbi:hypothetical protein [Absidia glauca]|uniref:Uncharacterized protein n=1 Tax=Absidia glauca TaxID=4829 RepID=A0A163JVE1_ABSGL|nr:hypothetical protein [Absidia glauca]